MKRCLYMMFLLLHIMISGIAQSEIDSLVQVIQTTNSDTSRVKGLLDLTRLYFTSNLSESVEYGTKALELAKEMNSLKYQYQGFHFLGIARFYQGSFEEALTNWLKAEKTLTEWETTVADSTQKQLFLNKRALILNNIGAAYKNLGEYDIAIEYYQLNLKIQEDIGDLLQIARGNGNIANIHFYIGFDFDKALEYYMLSHEHFRLHLEENPEDIEGRTGLATGLLNIGILYKELKEYHQAQLYCKQALNHYVDLNDEQGIARTQGVLGLVFLNDGNYMEALKSNLKALNLWREIGQQKEEAHALRSIGELYNKWRRYEEALNYMFQCLDLSIKLQLKKEVYDVQKSISEIYKEMGDYRSSLEHYEKYHELKDSIFQEDNLTRISELETKYETEKVERENVLLNTQNALQETELKRQRIFIFSVVGISLIILFFVFIVYNQYLEKKKANSLLEEQNSKIKQQRDKIFKQNQTINESINYAKHIQDSILLTEEDIKQSIPDLFIYNQPRAIVSGDFYWFHRMGDLLFAAAVDCTGHGVPGAFMCMIGNTLLNDIIIDKEVIEPAAILTKLNQMIKETLRQETDINRAQDGMDMSVIVLDLDSGLLKYAGAKNSIYLIKGDEIEELRASPWSIGGFSSSPRMRNKVKFTQQERTLQKNTDIYLFSDGYMDQFQSDSEEKFGKKRFEQLLVSSSQKPLEQQRKIISYTMNEWKGQSAQLDDILVIGIRI